MAAKFEVYTDKAGKYRFRLKSGNGQIVAEGQAYASRSDALEGVKAVRRTAAEAEVEVLES